MATNQQLDLTLINGYLEVLDINVIQQMLDLYIQQSALYIKAIETAVVDADKNSWQEQCHKMKGSAASAGLCQVHQQLIILEKSSDDWQTKAEQLRALAVLNQAAIETFQQWLAGQ
tara:strand:+ start:490 stop:837 length:348 start_codon:yes stop_codon:yes gene_type:complete